MIELSMTKGGDLQLSQNDVPPTVYLDHWAMRMFSEDPRLGDRLKGALESRGGTLALSWLNLIEFSKVASHAQARRAEEFVEAHLPRVFFLEVEPFKVIEREDALMAGGPPAPPHGDPEFLRAFIKLKPKSVQPFTTRELFCVMQQVQLAGHLEALANVVISRVETLREDLLTDLAFRSAVNRSPGKQQIQRGTRFLLRELLRSLLIDKGTRMTQNHAIDFLHAVVPLAYCEFVLLDKHWETQADRVRSRLSTAGLSAPIAMVFSGKADGVDHFLSAVESGPTVNHAVQRTGARDARSGR